MYIVGIDIAKRFHEAAIIDRNGNVVVKRIKFANSHAGFVKLMEAVRKLDAPVDSEWKPLGITGYHFMLTFAKQGKQFT